MRHHHPKILGGARGRRTLRKTGRPPVKPVEPGGEPSMEMGRRRIQMINRGDV